MTNDISLMKYTIIEFGHVTSNTESFGISLTLQVLGF